ncbi:MULTISPECIES: DUF262 domain-containing protein [Spirulina sp. CCY15215]|uniref:DUF262 domain-containing protein n=1 Tax=Spirulina sp. CCY15215 TaxID=2767591 RepID=UPI0019501CFD|nr:DUF262 domain-containing protein [Spirulina major]
MPFSETEEKMWTDLSSKKEDRKKSGKELSDRDIENRYEDEEQQILIKINREKLSSLIEAMQEEDYMSVSPPYQRRPRWKSKRQSKLIESLIMNIPVPPILLYEKNYNSYEVIDGQQRITAIHSFYHNQFKLESLEVWPELNGRTYQELPKKIRDGLNYHSLVFIIIIIDPDISLHKKQLLKQRAFERLNTGGIKLEPQEIRNCVYSRKLNDALKELSQHEKFARAWSTDSQEESNMYQKMEDVELVLRFFALRNVEQYKHSIRDFLDLYMINASDFTDEDIILLKKLFKDTIDLADKIYGETLFKPFMLIPDGKTEAEQSQPLKEYYDAVMVGLSKHIDNPSILINEKNASILINEKNVVIEETKRLLREDTSKIFQGQGSGKKNIQTRIELFNRMLSQIINSKI